MDLRYPASDRWPRILREGEPAKWAGLLLSEENKDLKAILLTNGASKCSVMRTILKHLTALAKEAKHTEQEFLDVIAEMLKKAEDAIPDMLRARFALEIAARIRTKRLYELLLLLVSLIQYFAQTSKPKDCLIYTQEKKAETQTI